MNISENIHHFWYEHGSAMILLIVALLLLSPVGILLFQPADPITISGQLVGKEYSPASTESGVGFGISPEGKPVTVVTSNSKAEKWTVVLLVGERYKTYSVDPGTFYQLEVDQDVELHCTRGRWIATVSCR